MQMSVARSRHWRAPALGCLILPPLAFLSIALAAQPAPMAASGYKLSTIATAPAGSSEPDSIAVVKETVWIGYGNGGKPDGSGGAKSTIVEYSSQGQVLRSLTAVGHNDGLRLDPHTKKL